MRGMMQGVMQGMMEGFFERLAQTLGAGAVPAPIPLRQEQPAPPPPPPPPPVEEVPQWEPRRKASTVADFKKNGAVPFLGKENPYEAEAWVMKIEKIFRVMECTDEEKVRLGTFMLEADAELWWQDKLRIWEEAGQGITWSLFKEAFYAKYFTEIFKRDKEMEFLELKQGSMSVLNYERKFAQLSRFAPEMVSNEASKCRRFQEGLRPSIREIVASHTLQTYLPLVEKAEVVEKEQEKKKAAMEKRFGPTSKGVNKRQHRSGSHSFGGRHFQRQDQSQSTIRDDRSNTSGSMVQGGQQSGNRQIGQIICRQCGKPGHFAKECKYRVCYRCGGAGHFAKDCPTSPTNQQGTQQPPRQQVASGLPAPQRTTVSTVPSTQQSGVDKGKGKAVARVFALNQQDVETSPSVVIGTFLILNKPACVLFDSGSTHTFASYAFIGQTGVEQGPLENPLYVATPTGGTVVASSICRNCPVEIEG